MTPAKLNLYLAMYPYSGNGSSSAEAPCIRSWFGRTLLVAKADERVGAIEWRDFCDTPITMTRNQSVQEARKAGADVLIMCDSDQFPDYELGRGDATQKPFFQSSFDFLYARRMKGQVTVIGAPYCGPPPHENVYVFKPATYESEHPGVDHRVEQFSREEAAIRAGFEEVIALPTGLIMFDMKVFDHIPHPYFDYEWEGDGPPCQHCGQPKPGPRAQKASTEDVVATRDMAMICCTKLGYNPVYVNWDAWAGHWKPKCVGKPRIMSTDMVSGKYREAILHSQPANVKRVYFRASDNLNGEYFQPSDPVAVG